MSSASSGPAALMERDALILAALRAVPTDPVLADGAGWCVGCGGEECCEEGCYVALVKAAIDALASASPAPAPEPRPELVQALNGGTLAVLCENLRGCSGATPAMAADVIEVLAAASPAPACAACAELKERLRVAREARDNDASSYQNIIGGLEEFIHNISTQSREAEALQQSQAQSCAEREQAITLLDAHVAALDASLSLCDAHQPDRWEGDGTCVLCEGQRLAALQQSQAQEIQRLKDLNEKWHEWARAVIAEDPSKGQQP